MRVAVVSHKGGVGKTTTAVHLAAYFQTLGPTLLIDADRTRNSLEWSRRGEGFPFRVETDEDGAGMLDQFRHTVIDTGQAQGADDLRAANAICDVILIPTVPASLDTHGLSQTINALRQLGPDKFRVLITKASRDAVKEIAELRGLLASLASPVKVLQTEIPNLKAYAKAAAAGQIVSQTKDNNAGRAWEAYATAGKELTA